MSDSHTCGPRPFPSLPDVTKQAKDAEAFAALQAAFASLKRAWPSAVPATGRAVPEAEVRANISRIALAMSRLR